VKALDFFHQLLLNIQATSLLEWVAVVTSIGYVILAAQSQRSCWYAAFTSALCYIVLSYNAQLFVDSVLNIFYAIMAVYGWFSWKSTAVSIPFTTRNWRFHFLIISTCILVGWLSGWWLDNHTPQQFPYIEATSFFLCLAATWMTTKKILDNWLYFVVIDAIMIVIYYNRSYALTSLLFVFYTLLALYAYLRWKKDWKRISDAKPSE
jgi:nicotinamide mononucleotide transporter